MGLIKLLLLLFSLLEDGVDDLLSEVLGRLKFGLNALDLLLLFGIIIKFSLGSKDFFVFLLGLLKNRIQSLLSELLGSLKLGLDDFLSLGREFLNQVGPPLIGIFESLISV